jgi:molybdopterin-guanine dinucleotide biosynthesis protein A
VTEASPGRAAPAVPARAPEQALSVLVLAGGSARRLAGCKADRDVGGQRLLDRVLDAARALSDDVLLLPGRRALDAPGVETRPDWEGVAGPLGGLGAGLAAARHDWCLLLPCDLPQPSAAVARALLARLTSSSRAVLLRDASGCQPFHGLYARSLLPELRAATSRGERSLLRFIRPCAGLTLVDTAELLELDGVLDCLRDVDTPEDLAAARRRWPAPAEERPVPTDPSPGSAR